MIEYSDDDDNDNDYDDDDDGSVPAGAVTPASSDGVTLPGFAGAAAEPAATSDQETAENPFLHLSMHLTISEQCAIDQPRGIRQAVELLTAKLGDLHNAHHQVMDCLGRMVWESQRSGRPPDGEAYIDHVRRLATKD